MLIVDLDDTLVASTKFNNDAYNYALDKFDFSEIAIEARITRENLTHIKPEILEKIVKEKQKYFAKEWLPYRLIVNNELLAKMKEFGQKSCFLWTKADKNRANIVIKNLRLKKYLTDIIFDNKNDFAKSLKLIKNRTKASEIIIYENEKLSGLKVVDIIENSNFKITGYLVSLQ